MRIALAVAVLAVCVAGETETARPLRKISSEEFKGHCSTQDLLIRNKKAKFLSGNRVTLVIDEHGRASISEAPDNWEFLPQAKSVVAALTCVPFAIGEKAAAVSVETYIRVLPPERLPKKIVSFPKIKDWKSLQISLDRTTCFGTCPGYKVTLKGDGTVEWEGNHFVAVIGKHRDVISQESLARLLKKFSDSDFFSFENVYSTAVSDYPTYTLCLSFDSRQKCVEDYAGEESGMPQAITELEDLIDSASGAEKWIKGNADTVFSLAQEDWDFKDPNLNKDLLAEVAKYGSADAVGQLLAQGTPISAGALSTATARKDRAMVQALLNAGADRNPTEVSEALQDAAEAADLELFRLLLSHSADPNYVQPELRYTLLMAGVVSTSPAMVEEILKLRPNLNAEDFEGKTALMYLRNGRYRTDEQLEPDRIKIAELLISNGANLEQRDNEGQTAIFANCYEPEVVKTLLSHGADPNTYDNQGLTPLMDCNWAETIKILLDGGANPFLRDKSGYTALERAISNKEKEKIELLRSYQAPQRG